MPSEKQKRNIGRRVSFPAVMQTRVPKHIREAVQKDLDRMDKEGVYLSESDWIRDAVIQKLKSKKLF
ncbi:MAG: hypothetical protein V1495_06980 [Pseudomonadota bacterium]